LVEITEADYKKAIEDAQTSMKESLESTSAEEGSITMNVYVNNRGEIIGRDFSAEESGNKVGNLRFASLNKGDLNEFSLSVTDAEGNKILTGNGTDTKSGDSNDGDINLVFSDPSLSLGLPADISLDIKYEGVRTELKNNRVYSYGTYTFSSPIAMGAELVIENSVTGEVQNCKATVQMGVTPLITFDAKTEYLKDFAIPAISGSEETYEDYESYVSSFDVETFISNLSDKLGVDLQSLMNGFMPNY
jgi:hypothetical protein